MNELVFVLAERQNHFFVELVEALADELDQLGVPSSVVTGRFPPVQTGRIYVLCPPHEFFALAQVADRPSREQLARTVFLCAEQPGSGFFSRNLELSPLAGAVLDINEDALKHFARRGVDAEHFQVGWTRTWCRADRVMDPGHPRERPIDVAHLGIDSQARGRALSAYGPLLQDLRCRLVLGNPDGPLQRTTPAAAFDDAKWQLLSDTRVLLNVHVADRPYFEWLRVVQAICCGAYVVSEHSVATGSLRDGEHLTFGSAPALALLAREILEDEPTRLHRTRTAYHHLETSLRMSTAVRRLVELATEVDEREVRTRRSRSEPLPELPAPLDLRRPVIERYPSVTHDEQASVIRSALKDVRLDLADLRRDVARLSAVQRDGREPPLIRRVRATRAWSTARPRVSVITALHNYENHIGPALVSVVRGAFREFELVVVDDASRDASAARVHEFMDGHEDVPALLLQHPLNRGLGAARNAALDFARGEFVFVLDADNLVFRHALGRHVEALDAAPRTSFAYGTIGRFSTAGPRDVVSAYPWEPERLRRGNYIDAMAMWRTAALRGHGGYTTDHRLWGWEDYDLWCRAAEAGQDGVHIPEILTQYRASRYSMLALTNISATTAVSMIIDRAPTVMADLEPPL